MTANQANMSGLSQADLDSYQQMTDKFKNTRFADILAANPYLSSTRKESPLEALMSFFGFRTAFDKDQENRAQAFRDYNAQVAQLASEDEYNSPAAQAQRMRAAGLNPDLQGVEGVQAASEFAQEQVSPTASEGENELANLASMALNIFQVGLGFQKDLLSFKQMKQAYDAGDIENVSSMFDVAAKAAGFVQSENDRNNFEYGDPYEIFGPVFSKYFRSRKNRKNFLQSFEVSRANLDNSVRYYTNMAESAKKRGENAFSRASQYFSMNDEAFQAMMRPLIKAQEDFALTKLRKDKQYQDTYDPIKAATAVNQENETIIQESQRKFDTNRVLSQIIHNLSQNALKGDNFSAILLTLWSIAQSKVSLPRIGK